MSESDQPIKSRLNEDVKQALRAGDKTRTGVLRLVMSAIKQREVDERIELDDAQVLTVLDKMVKQRRESIKQYSAAQRQDLADKEAYEIEVIQAYMPQPLDAAALGALIDEAISASGATSMQDMGKVMGFLKPRIQGRADMGAVSAQVKAKLGQ